MVFFRPDGGPIPEVPASPRPPVPAAGALVGEHQRRGIVPDAWTATPLWNGEEFDLSLAIVVLAAFPAVLLGGLESIPGAVVGGLLIGLAQGLVALPNNDFILGPEAAQAVRNSVVIVPYVILLIVLLVKPDGLFGQKRIERI